MLAVGHLPSGVITPTSSVATTTAGTLIGNLPVIEPASSFLNSDGLELPQGDQPLPPFRDGTPPLPGHWGASTSRTMFVQTRHGKYLEMLPTGQVRGVTESTVFSAFVLMSHFSFLVMKGFVSDKYLCMNNVTTKLYTSADLNESCYITEQTRSDNHLFFFHHCRVRRKRCTLGMYRNGTMRLGKEARQSQHTAQWLLKKVNETRMEEAQEEKDKIQRHGWQRPVNKREQRRKRARRWCIQLDVMLRQPDKYRKRCKQDCDLLEEMLTNSQRYMRRCLQRMVRRRSRMKALRSSRPLPKLQPRQVRRQVRKMWPKRHGIFSRLRKRRCSKIKKRELRERCRKKESLRNRKLRARGTRQAWSVSDNVLAGREGTRAPSRTDDVTSHPTTGVQLRHRHSKGVPEQHHRHEGPVPEARTRKSLFLQALTSR